MTFMCQFHSLLSFAQAQPDPEVTAGRVLAGLLVMMTMAASIAMLFIWRMRYLNTGVVIPTAARKPLRVPLLLTICGVVLMGMMALLVASGGRSSAESSAVPVTAETPSTDAVAPGTSGSPENGSPQADSEDGSKQDEDGSKQDRQAASENSDKLPTQIAADESNGLPDANLSTAANVENDTSEDSTAAAKSESTGSAAAAAARKFQAMLVSTLSINLMLWVVFGSAVLVSQQHYSRQLSHGNDVETMPQERLAVQQFEVELFPDLDAAPTSAWNPYASVIQPPQAEQQGVVSSQTDDAVHDVPLEPWNLNVELRFAAETFLAAYVPTTVLRLLILAVMPDAPSHPFLEIMEDGIDGVTVLLIGLMAVVVAPLVEELLYRVTILGGIWQHRSVVPAWIASSVLFSFAHGFPDSIALLPLAFAIGYVYLKRRSYRTVVLVHFLFNAFNMLVAAAAMV